MDKKESIIAASPNIMISDVPSNFTPVAKAVFNHLSLEDRLELLELLQERTSRAKRRLVDTYFPETGNFRRELYAKHMMFFDAGSKYKLRLFMAANRVGKTLAAAYEVTLHVTGRYPDWWTGKRFTHANQWWIAGVDSKIILSMLQPAMLGAIGDFGTGMIPYEYLDFETLKEARKADTPISIFRVKHVDGTWSSIEYKSYESGRDSFQSTARNIWADEEMPVSIFTECLLRTAKTGGEDPIFITTFTPLKGITETITNFLEGAVFHEGPIGLGKHVTLCSWDDVPHLSEVDKAILLASIPPWARDARTKGIPQMGSGAIYPIPMSEITVSRFEIPKHWKRYAGMDVGNKTAAVWIAIDPSTNVNYVYCEYYREGELPSTHVESIAGPGKWVPISIDHAAHGRSQIDGKNLFDMYKDLGLTLHNADKSVEAGLYSVWELLASGKLKVFNDLKKFLEEYQLYRKDERGRVVKEKDHIMDAFRYAIMTGRELAVNEMEATPQAYQGGVSPQFRTQNIIGGGWR